jgi:hypothetical protein
MGCEPRNSPSIYPDCLRKITNLFSAAPSSLPLLFQSVTKETSITKYLLYRPALQDETFI